jgi:predicted nucleic acid-binding protein
MKKTNKEIINQIRILLNELEGTNSDTQLISDKEIKNTAKKLTGCIGAIQDLIEENFFDEQKAIFQVVDKLKEEGQPYSRELVSMNLLNFIKPPRKVLRRIKEDGKWKYIIRK